MRSETLSRPSTHHDDTNNKIPKTEVSMTQTDDFQSHTFHKLTKVMCTKVSEFTITNYQKVLKHMTNLTQKNTIKCNKYTNNILCVWQILFSGLLLFCAVSSIFLHINKAVWKKDTTRFPLIKCITNICIDCWSALDFHIINMG